MISASVLVTAYTYTLQDEGQLMCVCVKREMKADMGIVAPLCVFVSLSVFILSKEKLA